MKYEERLVVFIDILGFKALMSDTVESNSGRDVPEKIREIAEA